MYIAPLTEYWIEWNGFSRIVVLQIEGNEIKFLHDKTSKIITMKLNKATALIELGSKKWAYELGGFANPKIVKSLEKNFAGKKGLSTHNGAQKKLKSIMNIVNSLDETLTEKKTISIDTAQDMRKAGYWILVTNNLKKVIAVDKDEKNLMKLQSKNRGKFKIFEPLKTIKISPEQQREYDRIHKLIWKNSKFGG